MKKNLRLKFVLLISLMIFPLIASAQCDTDAIMEKCASSLGTFNYIKSFSLTVTPRRKAKAEFSYVFSKGSTYMLIACNEYVVGGKMTVNLYDKDHNLIASTYDEATKKYYPTLLFPCSSTGVYYIRASFRDAKKGCGMCILGFNKE
jgi:hypothetical protein